MGNDLTKQFTSDDGYEVTVTIRKVAPGEAGEEEEGQQQADQNGNAASGHTNGTTVGTETEDEEPARRSGRKRGAELATPAASAPGPSTSVKQVKNSVGRPKKLAVDSPASPAASAPAAVASGGAAAAAGGDGFETPRGRRSTCITVGDTVNPSLDIQIIKSHLAPNYLLTLPADFVKKHFKDNQAYELVGGGTLKVVKHSATRFTLDKKFWSTFVQENNLGLKDGLHLELVGEALIRIDVFKAPLDMVALQDEGAAAAAAEAAAAALLSQQQEDVKTDTALGEAPAMVFAVDQTTSINLAVQSSDAQQC